MSRSKNKPLSNSIDNTNSTVNDLKTKLKKIEEIITIIQKGLKEHSCDKKYDR